MSAARDGLIPVPNLREWFRSSLQATIARQNLRADPHTEYYLVELLTVFARSENFYEYHRGGYGLRPLALMLADALEAPSSERRNLALQRLGDVSLFTAGFFPDSLAEEVVDVDYYSRMGGLAYETLSQLPAQSRRHEALSGVFRELAIRFGAFVDVLTDIAQMARVFTHKDVLRLYDVWIKTGSARAAEKLRELGIHPAAASVSRLQH